MKEITKDKTVLLEAINELADTVGCTLGPEGGTVGMTDAFGTPSVTKDGVSVAQGIEFKDPLANMAANLVKHAAKKTVKEAGDGTTSATLLAQAFINEGVKLNLFQRTMRKEFDKLENLVLETLIKSSREVTKDDIYDVAMVSCNGDKEMATIIDKAYSHSDVVQIDFSSGMEDELVTIEGMHMPGSYFDVAFTNNQKKQALDYQEVKFIVVEGKLNTLDPILKLITGEQQYPIIIMADHFSSKVVNIFKREYNQGNIAIGLLKTPGFAGHRKNLVKDIISYTDAKPFGAGIYHTQLDKVYADDQYITLGKDGASVDYLGDLTEAYEAAEEGSSKELLGKRITYLGGRLSIILVGGKSELERNERKDRMEDAVLAVKSAYEEGVVPGAGSILKAISEHSDLAFAPCLAVIYDQIKQTVPDLELTPEIIDPVKVVRCSVQNAISVAKNILSMKAMVVNPNLWR